MKKCLFMLALALAAVTAQAAVVMPCAGPVKCKTVYDADLSSDAIGFTALQDTIFIRPTFSSILPAGLIKNVVFKDGRFTSLVLSPGTVLDSVQFIGNMGQRLGLGGVFAIRLFINNNLQASEVTQGDKVITPAKPLKLFIRGATLLDSIVSGNVVTLYADKNTMMHDGIISGNRATGSILDGFKVDNTTIVQNNFTSANLKFGRRVNVSMQKNNVSMAQLPIVPAIGGVTAGNWAAE